MPSRSVLHRLIVVQTAGSMDSFDVTLFSSRDAALGNPVVLDGVSYPPELFALHPKLTGTGGQLYFLAYWSNSSSMAFGPVPMYSHEKSSLGQLRRIYLRIAPSGTGSKTFAAAATVSRG